MTWVHSRHRQPQGSHRSQAGAVLVEFAFVAIIIIVMAGGAFDYGMGWRMGLVTNEAARAGARTGSSSGNAVLTDWYALSGARASLASGGRLDNVQRVVIYASADASGNVPTQCTTGLPTSVACNELTGAQFRALAEADFDKTTGCISSTKERSPTGVPTSEAPCSSMPRTTACGSRRPMTGCSSSPAAPSPSIVTR